MTWRTQLNQAFEYAMSWRDVHYLTKRSSMPSHGVTYTTLIIYYAAVTIGWPKQIRSVFEIVRGSTPDQHKLSQLVTNRTGTVEPQTDASMYRRDNYPDQSNTSRRQSRERHDHFEENFLKIGRLFLPTVA